MAVESQPRRPGFDPVVQLRGGAMVTDVLHSEGGMPASSIAIPMARAGSSPHSSSRTRWYASQVEP